MSDHLFDNPEMSDSSQRTAGLPEAPAPDFESGEVITQADLLDTSPIPADPTLVGGAARMTGDTIGVTSGVDPSQLPTDYARHASTVMPPTVSPPSTGDEPLAVSDDLSLEDQVKLLMSEVQSLRSRSAGGSFAGCPTCSGSGRAQFVKRGQQGGYFVHGKPVMIRCPQCFPGGDVNADVRAAIENIKRGG